MLMSVVKLGRSAAQNKWEKGFGATNAAAAQGPPPPRDRRPAAGGKRLFAASALPQKTLKLRRFDPETTGRPTCCSLPHNVSLNTHGGTALHQEGTGKKKREYCT